MERIICFLCILMIIVSLAGCNRNNSPDFQKPLQSETEQVSENKELSNEKLAEIVAKNLSVPEKESIEYGVSEVFYWESAQRCFKNITFTENGEAVAGASVDPYTGELLRNIWEYDSSK